MVAPITSTIRGIASEVRINEDEGMKAPCVVNLHNIVTVAKTGIGRRRTNLSDETMNRVCDAIGFCLGCEGA